MGWSRSPALTQAPCSTQVWGMVSTHLPSGQRQSAPLSAHHVHLDRRHSRSRHHDHIDASRREQQRLCELRLHQQRGRLDVRLQSRRGRITPCDSPTTYAGLGDGAHTFRVEAVDAAGNADASPAVYSWQIAGVGPATIDRTPPGNVKRLKRAVGYGSLKLSWSRPSDSDFDHVEVFVSTSAKSLPRTPVYRGKASRYTNRRFRNGLYYRYAVVSYDRTGNASRGVCRRCFPQHPSSFATRRPPSTRPASSRLGRSEEGDLLQRPDLLPGSEGSEHVAELRQAQALAQLELPRSAFPATEGLVSVVRLAGLRAAFEGAIRAAAGAERLQVRLRPSGATPRRVAAASRAGAPGEPSRRRGRA